jgi:hypothetical protein
VAGLPEITNVSVAPPSNEDSNLELYLVFTDSMATRRILQAAGDLARDLGARLTLLAAQIVPYPLPVDCPTVNIDFTERMLSELVSQVEADIRVRLYLCRDRGDAIRRAIRPNSIVITSKEDRQLARLLTSDGHHVIPIQPNLPRPAGVRAMKERFVSDRYADVRKLT